MTSSGTPIACSSVTPIARKEQMQEAIKQMLLSFNEKIQAKIQTLDTDSDSLNLPDYFVHHDGENPADHITPEFDPIEEPTPIADEWDHEAYDKYISSEVPFPKGDQYVLGKVIGCKRDIHGQPIGQSNRNPILDP